MTPATYVLILTALYAALVAWMASRTKHKP